MSMNCWAKRKKNGDDCGSCGKGDKMFIPHGNGVVEQYECCELVTIQASLMNFITLDYYQRVAGSCEVSCGDKRKT